MATSQNSTASTHNNQNVSNPHPNNNDANANVIFHPNLFPPYEAPPPPPPPAPPVVQGVPINIPYVPILVRSMSANDEGVVYAIGLNDSMSLLYNEYAEKLDTRPWLISLYFNGRWMPPNRLAGEVGLYPYCTVFVFGQLPWMNLNANVKVFTVEETKTVGISRQFCLHRHTTVTHLVYILSDMFNVSPHRIILMRDHKIVGRNQTIMNAGIKNADKVYAFIQPMFA